MHVCIQPTTLRVIHQGIFSVNHEFIYKEVQFPESQLPSKWQLILIIIIVHIICSYREQLVSCFASCFVSCFVSSYLAPIVHYSWASAASNLRIFIIYLHLSVFISIFISVSSSTAPILHLHLLSPISHTPTNPSVVPYLPHPLSPPSLHSVFFCWRHPRAVSPHCLHPRPHQPPATQCCLCCLCCSE